MNSNPRNRSVFVLAPAALVALVASCIEAGAQATPLINPDGRNRLAHLVELERKLGPNFTVRLSSGGANMFHMAKVLSDPAMMRGANTPLGRQAMAEAMAKIHSRARAVLQHADDVETGRQTLAAVPVNDADLDFQLTRFGGFTQSETSSAWCGDTVVTGFNDSGAFVRSIVEGVGGSSFTNAAVSQNRGRSFTGLPFLNPGPDPGTFLGGDPVLVCRDARHFVFASLLSQTNVDSQGNVIQALTGISVSRSSSAGLVWDNPIQVVTKDASFHFLDKEWMAIDPHSPQNLYVTYTDFGAFGSDQTCNDHITPGGGNGGPDVRLEMVSSKDGGNSWSTPVLLDRQCNLQLGQNLSGSQVVVGPTGQVYVAYAFIDQKNAEIRIRNSQDGGATFAPTIVAAQATAASSLGFDHLEGNFRTNVFPALAVDTSADATRGTLYMAWTDASVNQVPDTASSVFFGDSVYSFGDIVLSVSQDGGNSWSKPRLVSPTPKNFKGAGRDQFMAGVAVDPKGNLAVCYSDRRNDPNNLAIDHFCSLSRDQGRSFRDVRETPSSWSPGHTTDAFVNGSYMGDYDAVSTDATGINTGFFSSFEFQTNTNPDVLGMRLKP